MLNPDLHGFNLIFILPALKCMWLYHVAGNMLEHHGLIARRFWLLWSYHSLAAPFPATVQKTTH